MTQLTEDPPPCGESVKSTQSNCAGAIRANNVIVVIDLRAKVLLCCTLSPDSFRARRTLATERVGQVRKVKVGAQHEQAP
jgi:hypothetical protein